VNDRHREPMEPNSPAERVSGVQQPDALSTADPGLYVVVEQTEQLAFHDFYGGSRDRVGRALAVTLGDADLAAESVDEAMARAYQRWSSVSRMDNPSGWVYRVGLNLARSRIRRLTRRRRVVAIGHMATDVPEPDVLEPAILRALRALPVDHRSVVVCRLLLGWSEAETAQALGIRPGTAKSRLHRATATLADQLSHLRPEAKS
jgi:RNA polymerase sigma-70 factor, ECF subfamily